MTVRTENGSTSFTITNDTQYTFRDIDIIVEVYVPNNGDYDYLGVADTITLGEWRSGDTTTIKVENSKIDSLVPSGKDPVFSLNWK